MRNIGKVLFVCSMLFVAYCLVLALLNGHRSGSSATDGNNSTGESSTSESTAPAESAQRVSALKLFIDHQRNEVAADNLYKGHLLAVVGRVTSINKDFLDKVYVSLATPNEFMNVEAHLNEESESEAAALQRGEVITLVCTGGGMIVGSPMLRDCSITKLRDDTQSGVAASQPPPAQISPQSSEYVANSSGPSDPQEISTAENAPEKAGAAVSAPVLLWKPTPEFPDAAKEANMGAKVLVHLIVGSDGVPTGVQAVRAVYIDHDGHASGGPNSAGSNLGFSESAVDSVRKYRFKPAIENGKPVPVEIDVNVDFQTP